MILSLVLWRMTKIEICVLEFIILHNFLFVLQIYLPTKQIIGTQQLSQKSLCLTIGKRHCNQSNTLLNTVVYLHLAGVDLCQNTNPCERQTSFLRLRHAHNMPMIEII